MGGNRKTASWKSKVSLLKKQSHGTRAKSSQIGWGRPRFLVQYPICLGKHVGASAFFPRSFGWCCFPSCLIKLIWFQRGMAAPPKEAEEGSTTTREREKVGSTTQKEGGEGSTTHEVEAAPPKRMRDRKKAASPTTKKKKAAPPEGMEGMQHHPEGRKQHHPKQHLPEGRKQHHPEQHRPQGTGRKQTPPKEGRGKQYHQKKEEESNKTKTPRSTSPKGGGRTTTLPDLKKVILNLLMFSLLLHLETAQFRKQLLYLSSLLIVQRSPNHIHERDTHDLNTQTSHTPHTPHTKNKRVSVSVWVSLWFVCDVCVCLVGVCGVVWCGVVCVGVGVGVCVCVLVLVCVVWCGVCGVVWCGVVCCVCVKFKCEQQQLINFSKSWAQKGSGKH